MGERKKTLLEIKMRTTEINCALSELISILNLVEENMVYLKDIAIITISTEMERRKN